MADEEQEKDSTNLGSGFNIHTNISSIHIDKKGSLKSRVILLLSLIAFWIPIVPAAVALIMIPSSRHQIEQSAGKLTGLRMISWGRALSWIAISLDIVGVLILLMFYFFAGDLLTRACAIDASYCQYIQYTVH